MPRAGFHAGTAAHALFLIHTADAVFTGYDGAHGARVTAGGVFALTAGIGEVGPVVLGVQTIAIAAGVQVAGYLDPGDVAGAAAVVGQRAVDFATLAAHAAVGIDDQQALGEGPYAYLFLSLSAGSYAQG